MGKVAMLIGIDASRAVKLERTGTEYYSQQIILGLARLDRDNQYILYAPNPPRPGDPLAHLPDNFRWKIMPFPRLWSQIRLSAELMLGRPKPAVVFEPAHTIPLLHHPKTVVTIHDLGFKYYPALYTKLERRYHNFSMDFSAKHAAHIITVSEYTRADVAKIYGTPLNKITAIHHGFEAKKYTPLKENELLPPKIAALRPYIYYIGRLEEKKNIVGLLEAFRLLREERGNKHKLVLAGKPGYGYEKIQAKIDALPPEVRNNITLLGYVPEDEAALLMRAADIFCFPSLFEGFGMPILEAMASGVPVVASKTTALPEVVGHAGILVNPKRPLDIAAGLSKVIHTPILRRTLTSKGLKWASLFSWDKAARATLAVLEQVASNKL